MEGQRGQGTYVVQAADEFRNETVGLEVLRGGQVKRREVGRLWGRGLEGEVGVEFRR